MKTRRVSCLGKGTHDGGGNGPYGRFGYCPRCGKQLTLTPSGRIPEHVPTKKTAGGAVKTETITITVTATWQTTHTFTVPADALDRANVGELGQLMDLIKSDPDGEGDITAECAELVDWSVR